MGVGTSEAMSATPLIQLLGELSNEPEARTAFGADPAGFLARSGHAGLDPSDLHEALGVMAEGLPTAEAAGLVETATLVDSAFVDSGDTSEAGDIDFGAGSGDAIETPDSDDALEEFAADLEPSAESDPDLVAEAEPDGADDYEFGHGDLDVMEEEAPDDLDAADPFEA
jgi:hypothetical protein